MHIREEEIKDQKMELSRTSRIRLRLQIRQNLPLMGFETTAFGTHLCIQHDL